VGTASNYVASCDRQLARKLTAGNQLLDFTFNVVDLHILLLIKLPSPNSTGSTQIICWITKCDAKSKYEMRKVKVHSLIILQLKSQFFPTGEMVWVIGSITF
jgi:hypothetical protein